jgi:hypothetical protein
MGLRCSIPPSQLSSLRPVPGPRRDVTSGAERSGAGVRKNVQHIRELGARSGPFLLVVAGVGFEPS